MKCFKALPLLLLLPFAHAYAEDLGVIGSVYEVREESALSQIMNKLKKMEQTGELKKLQDAAVQRSMYSAKNPRPVSGVTRATKYSKILIDPTVTYKESITDDMGNIVVPAGTSVNPLDYQALSMNLVFIDGTDDEAVNAALKMYKKDKQANRFILVRGSWFEVSKLFGTQIYFDQMGVLCKRFGITQVPAVISQDGRFLQLEEIPAKDLGR